MSNRIGLYLIVLGAFVTGTAELVVGGILDIIAADLHVSVGVAGQLVTAYSVAFAIATPIVVSFTARVSRKKLLIASLIVFLAGSIIVPFIPFSTSFAVLLLSRALLGASAGVFAVVAFSAAAKLVPPERTGRAVGMVSLGVSTATVLGVPAGVLISGWWTWQGIFMILAILGLLVTVGIMRFLPEVEGDTPVPFARQFTVLRNPVLLTGLVLSFSFSTSASIMNTYMVPILQDMLRLPSSSLSMALLILGISGMIGSRAGGIGIDKQGSARIIVFGLSLNAIILYVLSFMTGVTIGGVTLVAAWSFAMSLSIPAILTYFIQQEPGSSNLILGLNTSILHLGVAVGAASGGALANAASTVVYHPVVAGSLSTFGLLAAAVSFAMGSRRRKLNSLSEKRLPI